MSKKIISVLTFLSFLLVFSAVRAQNATDVLRNSLQYPSYDPVTIVMPGTAYATGFGAYQENPAVMALFDESFFSGGLSDRYVSEKGMYLGNRSSFDVNALGIADVGLVYKMPTQRGSLVIGGGYSQTTGFNRALSGFGFNDETTLTDSYVTTPDDDLFFAALDAFAIDFITPEQNYDETASIFRADSPYKGIHQTFELTEKGVSGEYSLFFATELFKNFNVGVSIGAIAGTYSYRRDFIEIDKKQNYETQFKDEQGNLIGIDNILNEDTIEANFTGFSGRVGILYQVTPHFNIGAGYQFANIIFIDEEFNTIITNTLDDGSDYREDAPGHIKYKIKRPARLQLGIALKNISGFTFTGSIENVAYSDARIRFDDIRNAELENSINKQVKKNLTNANNLRLGLEYKINDILTPRIGYGYYPSPIENKNADRQFYSAGFTAQMTHEVALSVGVQYAVWDDETTIYSSSYGDERMNEDVNRWNIMAGFTYYFE